MSEDHFHLGIKALIRNDEGKILLLKTNPDMHRNDNPEPYWDIPGGRIDKGDTIEGTLRRELKEETGIETLNSFSQIGMSLMPGIRLSVGETDVGLILAIYICDVGAVEDVVLSDEHTEYAWFDSQAAAEIFRGKFPEYLVERMLQIK